MAQPLVKYTLNKKGQVPDWIDNGSDSFSSQHGISGNKEGCIPRYESPQDMIWIGLATGDVDSDGTPDSYVGSITTKSALTTYLKTVGNTLKYKTVTSTVTGVQTSVTTGLSTAWGQENYSGGLSTSTTSKHTVSGVGTVATISTGMVTKVVTVVDTPTGSSISTVSTPVTVDPASTISGVSTSVGIVTTTGSDISGVTTTTTTTDTTSFTYTDVQTTSSTSTSETTTDGVTTRTDTVTTTEKTNYETSYDYAAEATRLWNIYTALNS